MSDSGGSSSSLEVKEYPSAYGTTDYSKSSDLAKMLEKMVLPSSGGTDIYKKYEKELLDPEFLPQTLSEEELINSLISRTGGNTAIRGLGTPTQTAIASAVAPELAGLRSDRVSSLSDALGLETSELGLDSSTLLNLINYAMPQVLSSNNQNMEGADQTGQMMLSIAGTIAAFV